MSQGKDGAWGPGYGDNPSPGHRSRAGGGDLTCVPVVAAAPPGQVGGEAAEEVEEGPGQDDDVVDVEEDDNGLGGIADTWGGGRRGWGHWAGFWLRPPLLRRGSVPPWECPETRGVGSGLLARRPLPSCNPPRPGRASSHLLLPCPAAWALSSVCCKLTDSKLSYKCIRLTPRFQQLMFPGIRLIYF